MSFTHGWLFFFYSTPTSSPPPSPPTHHRSACLLPILRRAIPPALFHFLFKWLHPHCFVCLERPGSGSPGILLLPRSCGGWSEQGAARVNGDGGVRGGWGGGGSRAAAERRGCCQICQRRGFQFTRRGRRGSSRAKRSEMGGLVFLDGYILSTCHPPENNRGSWGVGSSTGAFVFWGEIWWMKVSWN